MIEDLEKLTVEQLAAQIEYHNRKYWEEAEPEISDEDYDLLVRRLTALAPDHPILWGVPETNYLKFYIFQVC